MPASLVKALSSSKALGDMATGSQLAPEASTRPESGTHPEKVPKIPDYDLLKRIGGGAYGEVWLARNVLGELRAVKVIYRSRFTDPRPFEREFEGIRRFEPISRSHPSQLAILHVGKNDADGCFYYVMELADNACASREAENTLPGNANGTEISEEYAPHTLRWDIEQRGRLPAAECVQIGLSLAKGLTHLHEQGLVHRDIKPSNVIFVNGVPKLGDIGLVTEAGDTQSIVGTEGYIPPEGPGTPPADIFSLGKVLYEISSGMDRRRFPELPQDLRQWTDSGDVAELNEILLRACARDPARRYQAAEDLRRDLERLQGGGSIRRDRHWEKVRRLGLRTAAWLMVIAILTGLVAIVTRAWQPSVATHSRKAGMKDLVSSPRELLSQTSLAPRRERPSTNEVANRQYQLAQFHYKETTGTNFQKAAFYCQQAIKADPNFAQAYALLALTYMWTDEGWGGLTNEFLPLARETALKALVLDPSLPEPHIVLAWYSILVEWDWANAEQEFQTALRLDDSRALFHHFYAELLRMSGRTNESLAQMRVALSLDAGSISLNERWVDHLISAREFEQAVEAADAFMAMKPDTPYAARDFKVRALCALGKYPEAIRAEQTNMCFGANHEAGFPRLPRRKPMLLAGSCWERTKKMGQRATGGFNSSISVHPFGLRGSMLRYMPRQETNKTRKMPSGVYRPHATHANGGSRFTL
jgi:serine/threonine protein kinase/Tfp pilus assembly protein PilF